MNVKLYPIYDWKQAIQAIWLIVRGRAVSIGEFIPDSEFYKKEKK